MKKYQAKAISILLFLIIMSVFPSKKASLDASMPWQVGFQDPATPIMEGIFFFNGLLMTFMLLIACLVGWLLYQSLALFNEAANPEPVSFNHSTLLEVVWTIIPAGILMIISVPSYNLLYAMEEVIDPSLTIKVVGHQWYWSYEVSDFEVSPKKPSDLPENLEGADVTEELPDSPAEPDVNEGTSSGAPENSEGADVTEELPDSPAEPDVNGGTSNGVPEVFADSTSTEEASEAPSVKESTHDAENVENLEEPQVDSTISPTPEEQAAARKLRERMSPDMIEFMEKEFPVLAATGKCSDAEALRMADQTYEAMQDIARRENEKKGKPKDGDDGDPGDVSVPLPKETPLSSEPDLDEEEDDLIPASDSKENDKKAVKPFELTRLQRDYLNSLADKEYAVEDLAAANENFELSKSELAEAKKGSTWAIVDAAATKVSKLSAKYFCASVTEAINNPALARSKVLRESGYDGWTELLKLENKTIADPAKEALIQVREDMLSAERTLAQMQLLLTEEQREKSRVVSSNASREYREIEKKNIPLEEELAECEAILKSEEEGLRVRNEIANKCAARYKKAKEVFSKDLSLLNRYNAQLEGSLLARSEVREASSASHVFDSKAKTFSEISKNEPNLGFTESKIAKVQIANAKNAVVECENLHRASLKEYLRAGEYVDITKKEHTRAKKRISDVRENLINSERVLTETPVIHKRPRTLGESQDYYDNSQWEMHNRDYLLVEAQYGSAEKELSAAMVSSSRASKHFNKVLLNILELEIKIAKAVVDLRRLEYAEVEELNNSFSSVARSKLCEAEKKEVAAIGKMMNKLSPEANIMVSRTSRQIIAELLAEERKEKEENPEMALTNSEASKGVEIDFDRLDAELTNAHNDYRRVAKTFSATKGLLGEIESILANPMGTFKASKLKKLWSLQRESVEALDKNIDRFEKVRSELSVFDAKLNEGLVEAKAYAQYLLARHDYHNAKLLLKKVKKDGGDPDFKSLSFSGVSPDETVDDLDERQRINFDSYLIADDDLVIPEPYGTAEAGKVFRLLEVDNRLFVPTNTHIRLLVTSADVLHSWAVPSLGIKVDACPGRLNQVFLFLKREGVFYGQCSELCGVNHGFMPIVVEAVNQDDYLTWVGKRLCS